MKTILSVLLLIPTLAFSNVFSEIVDSKNIGEFDCNTYQDTDIETDEKSKYVMCFFQNMEYEHIVDRGVIYFDNQDELDVFIEDLKKYQPYLRKKGYNLEFGKNTYMRNGVLYFLDDSDGPTKYQGMWWKGDLKKIIKWLSEQSI